MSSHFQADEDVEKFLEEEEHTFEDYEREVRKYSKLEKEILYYSRKVRHLNINMDYTFTNTQWISY